MTKPINLTGRQLGFIVRSLAKRAQDIASSGFMLFALPDSHYEAANLKNKWLKIRLSSVEPNKFCLRSVFSGNEVYPNFSTSARQISNMQIRLNFTSLRREVFIWR